MPASPQPLPPRRPLGLPAVQALAAPPRDTLLPTAGQDMLVCPTRPGGTLSRGPRCPVGLKGLGVSIVAPLQGGPPVRCSAQAPATAASPAPLRPLGRLRAVPSLLGLGLPATGGGGSAAPRGCHLLGPAASLRHHCPLVARLGLAAVGRGAGRAHAQTQGRPRWPAAWAVGRCPRAVGRPCARLPEEDWSALLSRPSHGTRRQPLAKPPWLGRGTSGCIGARAQQGALHPHRRWSPGHPRGCAGRLACGDTLPSGLPSRVPCLPRRP